MPAIGLVSGSTGNQVIGNQSFSNAQGYQRAAAGIHLYEAPGNIVADNITHDNEDSGINCYPSSNNCLIYNNVAYNNGDHGTTTLSRPALDHRQHRLQTTSRPASTWRATPPEERSAKQHQRRQRHRQPAHAQRHPGREGLDRRYDDGLQTLSI